MGIRRWWANEVWATKVVLACGLVAACLVVLGIYSKSVQEREFAKLPQAEQQRILTLRRAEDDRMAAEARARSERIEKRTAAKQEEERQRRAIEAYQDQVADAHKASVKACVEAAKKYLPGIWPSSDALAKIEADCAEREARSEGDQR